MAKIVYEPGDVFRNKYDKVGVVLNDIMVLIIEGFDGDGAVITGESYPEKMTLIPEDEVKSLPFETQCVIKGIKATLVIIGR